MSLGAVRAERAKHIPVGIKNNSEMINAIIQDTSKE